jgi:hypothetical protein
MGGAAQLKVHRTELATYGASRRTVHACRCESRRVCLVGALPPELALRVDPHQPGPQALVHILGLVPRRAAAMPPTQQLRQSRQAADDPIEERVEQPGLNLRGGVGGRGVGRRVPSAQRACSAPRWRARGTRRRHTCCLDGGRIAPPSLYLRMSSTAPSSKATSSGGRLATPPAARTTRRTAWHSGEMSRILLESVSMHNSHGEYKGGCA